MTTCWCNAADFLLHRQPHSTTPRPHPSPHHLPQHHPTHPLPPPPLVDTQLEERAFNEALGTHTLPFRSGFHNQRAQFQRLSVTRLHQRGLPGTPSQIPLGPPPRHPSHQQSPTQMDTALIVNRPRLLVPLNPDPLALQ